MGEPSSDQAAAALVGGLVGSALAESAEVDYIASENGNGTWYEVALQDGTLVQVTVAVSRG